MAEFDGRHGPRGDGKLCPKRGGAWRLARWVLRNAFPRSRWLLACGLWWFFGDAIFALAAQLFDLTTQFVFAHWLAAVVVLTAIPALFFCWVTASSVRDSLQRREPGDHVAEVAKKFLPKKIYEEIVGEMVGDFKEDYATALANNSPRWALFCITFRYRIGIATGMTLWALFEAVEFAKRLVAWMLRFRRA
jgi:hypothetical protein